MDLTLIIIGLFILGSIFGSLGSVLVTRLGKGVNKKILQGICFGFSRCPTCKKQLKPRNLIPIISFFLQKGRCEYCQKPISKFYPTLEILSGIIFVLTFLLTRNLELGTSLLIFWLIINRLLLLLVIYDFQKLELHVPLRVVALAASLLGQFFFPIGNYGQAFFLSLILGGICIGLFYGAKRYVKKVYKVESHKVHKVESEDIKTGGPDEPYGLTEGFGQGDVMLGFLLGTLMPSVFLFNHIPFSGMRALEILILFFVLSSALGLLRYGIMKLTTNNLQLRVGNYKLLTVNCKLKVLPFIPFMIFAFRILLYAGRFFINSAFPRG